MNTINESIGCKLFRTNHNLSLQIKTEDHWRPVSTKLSPFSISFLVLSKPITTYQNEPLKSNTNQSVAILFLIFSTSMNLPLWVWTNQ